MRKVLIIILLLSMAWCGYGQQLWMETYVSSNEFGKRKQNFRYCHEALWLQTKDTIYGFHSGKEEWQGNFSSSFAYLQRGDSLFQTVSQEQLFALSSDPASLPDSLKGPYFLGRAYADSLMIRSGFLYGTHNVMVLKPISAKARTKRVTEAALTKLLTDFSLELDGGTLSGRESPGVEVEVIKYPAKKSASYPGDPFPRIQGLYKINDVYFLLVPVLGERIYQIVDLTPEGLVLESFCGNRRLVKVAKKK